MLPSPSELKYFIEISNTLNLSRAAERLGISQPTLTLAVRRLEDSFGLPLLIRSKSGVQMTQAGQRLVSQARQLILEWERITSDAGKAESEVCGRYTLGCHPSVALYSLPHFLTNLLVENEGLEIKLVHDLSRKITEDVISFKLDFGIVVNPWNHPDLVIRPLTTDIVSLWVAKKRSPLQQVKGGKGVLICDPDLLQTQDILKQLAKKDIKFQRIITTSNLEVVAGLVDCGSGVGILPSRVAKRIPSWGLQPFCEDAPKFSDKIALVYRADAQHSKASRILAKAIESSLLQN